jgi:hypothetical protein
MDLTTTKAVAYIMSSLSLRGFLWNTFMGHGILYKYLVLDSGSSPATAGSTGMTS